MFAEDLPQGDQVPQEHASDPSAPNMFSMRFTVSDTATDYDLYVGNPRRPNNNPNRGRLGRGRAPIRGRALQRGNPRALGRGQPRVVPRGRGLGVGPARNLRVRAQPAHRVNPPNPPHSNPNPPNPLN